MKLLITGGNGFLGRRAVAQLSGLGYEVFAPDHATLDITDISSIETWFSAHSPQAVIHCAAISDTGRCQREPDATAQINVHGSTNLAKLCGHHGVKLIFCSSDQVYAGSPVPGPHCESEPLSPSNEYARQKLSAEQECLLHCPDTVCLRLSWMYSIQFQPGEHGHLLSALSAAFQDETLPLTWPIHDRRGITDVDSVIKNLPDALNLPAGVYNFGSGNTMDTFHTLQSVFRELKLESAMARLQPNTQAFSDSPRDIRMDGTKLSQHGIIFEDTAAGLSAALNLLLRKR